MSFKVYNGYRLAPGTDVLRFSQKVREVIIPIRQRLEVQSIQETAVAMMNDAWLGVEDKKDTRRIIIGSAWMTAEMEHRDDNEASDPTRFKVVILGDPETDDQYALLYCHEDAYVQAWESLEEVSEYGYWDNVDQPRSITDQEWAERRAVWDRILGHRVPSECGVSFEVDVPSREKTDLFFGRNVPEEFEPIRVEPQAHRLARNLVFSRVLARSSGKGTKFWRLALMDSSDYCGPLTRFLASRMAEFSADDLTKSRMTLPVAPEPLRVEAHCLADEIAQDIVVGSLSRN